MKTETLTLSDPATLRELAQLLDRVLNGNESVRREGFILVRFKHNQVTRPNYISSCPPEESIRLLKLLLAQLEGRLIEEEGHA